MWVTRDGGAQWTNLADKVGLPGPRWVASIEPSRYVEGRAYVAFDAHRSNDDEPYVYVTEDFGQTWKSIRANLPRGSSRVCREDIQNQNILYVGTEFAAYVSANRGASWTKLNSNLPTVAVHEFAQHPTAGEIVVATHGRSLWVLDVTALRQMTPEVLKAKAHLYGPNTVVKWQMEPGRGGLVLGEQQALRRPESAAGCGSLLLARAEGGHRLAQGARLCRQDRPRMAGEDRAGITPGRMGLDGATTAG